MHTDTDSTEHSARRVHRTLGGTTTFWADYTLGELALFLLPPFVGVVLLGLPVVPAAALVPVIGGVVVLELALFGLHRFRPDHLRLTEWLAVSLEWLLKHREYDHRGEEGDTLGVTRLRRAVPSGVERSDGALVGAIEVHPANMALEDDESWRDAVRSLSNFANSALDFDAQFYITTREVDDAGFVQSHRDRLDDADVARLPVLRELLERFVDRNTDRDGTVDREATALREYYVVVAVTEADIDSLETREGLRSGLAEVPVVGRLFARYRSRQLTAAEREALKEKKLSNRLAAVRRGVNSLYRCTASPVSPYELVGLTAEYWSCQPESYDDIERTVGTFSRLAHGLSEGIARPGEPEETAGSDSMASRVDAGAPSIESTGRRQQALVAPSTVDWTPDHAIIDGHTYARTFWVEQFPERPEDGLFERLLLDADLQADLSVHVEPYDSQSALALVGDWISTLQTTQQDVGELRAEDIEDELDRARQIRRLVRKNVTGLYRTGVFVRLTADSEEELRRKTTKLESVLRDAPANCTLKRVVRQQEAGLATVSPIGRNELGDDRCSTMTGAAVGALFPFSSNYLRMPEGIEYGTHGHNTSAIHVDPWGLETGHSELVTGMPGAGKTHAAQARALRTMKRHDDVLQVIIDPVGDMRGTAHALDAKYITVSGKTPLNPCEMHPTPEHVLEKSRDMEPVAAKKAELYGVIENFLASRNVDLQMHSGVVSYAIDRIYATSAIDPEDVNTHTPANSPTMRDLLETLDDIAERPGRHDIASGGVTEARVSEYAAELAIALQPFREGSTYANLSEESDLDVLDGDSRVVYIDLQQIEGTSDGLGRQSFIMQLLLGVVYQQAKRTDQRVEVCVDEAHYLFDDDANLAFLNQIARHQRHAGLRLVFLSQTLQEFYDEGVAEEIAGMCPIKIHHREPGLDERTARTAGLTDDQRWFVQNAEAGKEATGYSEALVRVGEHGDYPLTITTTEEEKLVIEYDREDQAALDAILDEETQAELRRLVDDEAAASRLRQTLGMDEATVDRVLDGAFSAAELVAGITSAIEGPDRAGAGTVEADDD